MIYTFSRAMVEDGLDLVEPYALISISTPSFSMRSRAQDYQEDNHPAKLPADEFRMDILRLAFWDLDESAGQAEYMRDDKFAAQVMLYCPEDARRVARFVKAWVVDLVIHCDAGISRSQGMANAIADHLDVDVKHSTRGVPNRHVYRLTWEALRPAEKGIPPAELAARAWAGSMKAMRPDVTLPPRGRGKGMGKTDRYQVRYSDGE